LSARSALRRIGLAIFEAQRSHAERSGELTALDEILIGVDAYSSSSGIRVQTNGPSW